MQERKNVELFCQSLAKHSFYYLFLLALIARLLAYWQSPYVSRDACSYMEIAQKINSHGFSEGIVTFPWLPPLFPLLVSLPEKMGFVGEVPVQLLFIVFNVLALIPICLLAQRIFGIQTARILFFLLALHPKLVEYSYAINRESLYLVCMLWSIYFAYWSISERKMWLMIMVGITAGLAYLSRQEALEVILALLFVLFVSFFSKVHDTGRIFKSALLALVFFAITLLPMVYYCRGTNSTWDPFGTYRIKLFLYHAGLTENPDVQ